MSEKSAKKCVLGVRNCMVQQDFICKNFQPSISSNIFHILHVLSTGNGILNAGHYLEQQTFHFELFCRNFQPSKKGFQTLDLGLKIFSKAGMLLHISCTTYFEDSHDILNSFVNPPKPLLIEGCDYDVARVNEGLLYDFFSNDNDGA